MINILNRVGERIRQADYSLAKKSYGRLQANFLLAAFSGISGAISVASLETYNKFITYADKVKLPIPRRVPLLQFLPPEVLEPMTRIAVPAAIGGSLLLLAWNGINTYLEFRN